MIISGNKNPFTGHSVEVITKKCMKLPSDWYLGRWEAVFSQGASIHSTNLWSSVPCTMCCQGCPEIQVFAPGLRANLLPLAERNREGALKVPTQEFCSLRRESLPRCPQGCAQRESEMLMIKAHTDWVHGMCQEQCGNSPQNQRGRTIFPIFSWRNWDPERLNSFSIVPWLAAAGFIVSRAPGQSHCLPGRATLDGNMVFYHLTRLPGSFHSMSCFGSLFFYWHKNWKIHPPHSSKWTESYLVNQHPDYP